MQKAKSRILETTYIALFAALIAVCAFITIPMPLPFISFTLQTFGVFAALGILGGRDGTTAVAVYILLGAIGVPVFSGFRGGFGVLIGPTGGYIIGFIPMAIVAGIIIDKFHQRWIQIVAMIIGTAICYAFGTVWFCFQSGYTVAAALAVCVIPFIPADLIKIVIVTIIGPMIRKRLGTVIE